MKRALLWANNRYVNSPTFSKVILEESTLILISAPGKMLATDCRQNTAQAHRCSALDQLSTDPYLLASLSNALHLLALLPGSPHLCCSLSFVASSAQSIISRLPSVYPLAGGRISGPLMTAPGFFAVFLCIPLLSF